MENRDKVASLIGFALKAGKVVFGADNIEKRGRVKLIICCKTLSENTLERLMRLKAAATPVIISQNLLEDITYKQGVKAIAITDKQMSEAIQKNLTSNYEIVREEKPV